MRGRRCGLASSRLGSVGHARCCTRRRVQRAAASSDRVAPSCSAESVLRAVGPAGGSSVPLSGDGANLRHVGAHWGVVPRAGTGCGAKRGRRARSWPRLGASRCGYLGRAHCQTGRRAGASAPRRSALARAPRLPTRATPQLAHAWAWDALRGPVGVNQCGGDSALACRTGQGGGALARARSCRTGGSAGRVRCGVAARTEQPGPGTFGPVRE